MKQGRTALRLRHDNSYTSYVQHIRNPVYFHGFSAVVSEESLIKKLQFEILLRGYCYRCRVAALIHQFIYFFIRLKCLFTMNFKINTNFDGTIEATLLDEAQESSEYMQSNQE